MAWRATLFLASALTPLHPGSGRGMGSVDLEVVRDPLGYPYIRGSMVKGALKTALAHRLECIRETHDGRGGRRYARVDCEVSEHCRALCCLLGSDIVLDEEGQSSRMSFLDIYPLGLPAPVFELSSDSEHSPHRVEGVVFVTTPKLISRVMSILLLTPDPGVDSCGGTCLAYHLKKYFQDIQMLADESLDEAEGVLITASAGQGDGGWRRVIVKNTSLLVAVRNPSSVNSPNHVNLEHLVKWVQELNPLYRRFNPLHSLLVVRDDLGRSLINQLLHRTTRIRLDRVTKTVARGALWTEEYLPWGTLFLGGVVETLFASDHCSGKLKNPHGSNQRIIDWVNQTLGGKLVIGGNETVGAGIISLRFPPLDSQG